MTFEPRVLDPEPVPSLDEYRRSGGGKALETARGMDAGALIGTIEASGLRGRGGAGFPTGTKWRTVWENRSDIMAATVVVNAAEGEPGTFKDRLILRRNPYRVLEGALIAASTLGANGLIVAMKASFETELERVRAAIDEVRAADWADDVEIYIVEGPSHYLYGEETALLEVIAGRNPFPRIAPPFRHGVDEVTPESKSAADETMAGPEGESDVPPTLVNNVETFANVSGIVVNGADWFRSIGTEKSPGSVVCTVSGRTYRHGVAEFPLGTPLGEVIETIGQRPSPGTRWVAAMSGVANPLILASKFDTPMSYEDLEAVGSGIGSAGFIVFDDSSDLVAVAHGVSRFLAVESCGQCTPCKQDGLGLSHRLELLRQSQGGEHELAEIKDRAATVSEEARCYLAHQHQRVIESVLDLFPGPVRSHVTKSTEAARPELIAPIVDIENGAATLDEHHADKQPDWTYEEPWSGQSPADRVSQASDLIL